jgi:hypothetical protein
MTLSTIAATDYRQIRTAALNRRLLVPKGPVPHSADVVDRRFVPLSPEALNILLTTYRDAGAASRKVTEHVIEPLKETQARRRERSLLPDTQETPSRDPDPWFPASENLTGSKAPSAEPAAEPEVPGPIERIVRELGVKDPLLLHRATTLDGTTRRLVEDALLQTVRSRRHSALVALLGEPDAAPIINYALGYTPRPRREPRAAAKPSPQREQELEAG